MIFCDMDGVLVDFDNSFKLKFGENPADLPRQQRWNLVLHTPNYWVNLPPKNDAENLINFLLKEDFQILTGLPNCGYEKADKEKRQWVKKYLGDKVKVICCLSKDKQNYIQNKNKDILIDDRESNIKNWEEKGGIGILHKSAQETIDELQKYGYGNKTLK